MEINVYKLKWTNTKQKNHAKFWIYQGVATVKRKRHYSIPVITSKTVDLGLNDAFCLLHFSQSIPNESRDTDRTMFVVLVEGAT